MTEEQRKKQTIEWIVNLILLVVGLYNAAAMNFSWPHLEIVNEEITQIVTVIYNAIVPLWCYWRNNNITQASKEAQVVLDELKKNPDLEIEIEKE